MSIELVMPFNHLNLCHPLLLPSAFPSIRVFSKESVLHIRWPKNWSFSFSISPSNEYSGLISFRIGWLDLLAVQETFKNISNTTVQKHQFFSTQLSLLSNSHIHKWLWMNFIYSQTTLKIKKTCNILQHTIALTNLGWEWLRESNHSCPFHTYPKASWIKSIIITSKSLQCCRFWSLLWYWRR